MSQHGASTLLMSQLFSSKNLFLPIHFSSLDSASWHTQSLNSFNIIFQTALRRTFGEPYMSEHFRNLVTNVFSSFLIVGNGWQIDSVPLIRSLGATQLDVDLLWMHQFRLRSKSPVKFSVFSVAQDLRSPCFTGWGSCRSVPAQKRFSTKSFSCQLVAAKLLVCWRIVTFQTQVQLGVAILFETMNYYIVSALKR